MRWRHLVSGGGVIVLLVAGCAAPPSAGAGQGSARTAASSGDATTRITLGTTVEQDLRPTARGPASRMQALVNSPLTFLDGRGERHPFLAETVPSLENRLWKLLPDGRMETIWRIRAEARWHDGARVTSDDLLFSLALGRDSDLAAFNSTAYSSIDDATAVDSGTLLVTWKHPYVDADALFDFQPQSVLPRHRLERAYREDKTGLLDLPHWTHEYVGSGPYRVQEWTPGLGALLEAHREYALGRPKIDQIEVRFIPDLNTLAANLLAGSVDVSTLGSPDLGLQLRDQWREGSSTFSPSGTWMAMFPQFINPHPSVISDVRFRRAMVYAVDRQEIVDTLIAGLSPVAHSILSPGQPRYEPIEVNTPRYPHEPRRAADLLQELGYAKAADGSYQDADGQRLELEVRTGPQDQAATPGFAVAGYWERFGVRATAVRTSPQRASDAEYRATFPAFEVSGGPTDVTGLRQLRSSVTPLPGNQFRVPGTPNKSRYMNPEFDALIDDYFGTVPVTDRIQVLGQIIGHMAEHLTVVGLYYVPDVHAVSDRLRGLTATPPRDLLTWNAHEWVLR